MDRGEDEVEAIRNVFEVVVGLLGEVRGVVVEDETNLHIRRVAAIQQLEKFNELSTAMPVSHQVVNLTRHQIDPGEQTAGSMANVFELPGDRRMTPGHRRQVRCLRLDGLDSRPFVIADDHRGVLLTGSSLQLHLLVDKEDLDHLVVEIGIAPFQVVADFVRSHFVLGQDLRHGPSRHLGQTRMTSI